ncbi:MAG: DUF4390 domain-containing protein [bacterium]
MRQFDKGLNFFLFLLLTLYLNIHKGFAGEGGEIRVDQIEPRLNSGYLTVSAGLQNLFSTKIVGTIQSGLPSIIEIEIKLLQAGKKSVLRKRITRSISYNIWEERYSIQSEDTTEFCFELEKAKYLSSHLDHIALIRSSLLDSAAKYSIQIRVGIIPISMHQQEKLADWLQEPNQTEEYLASEDRSSGFKLNISKLVSFFVGGNKRPQNSSKWYSSKIFRVEDLKH